jgi:hypothetical protein
LRGQIGPDWLWRASGKEVIVAFRLMPHQERTCCFPPDQGHWQPEAGVRFSATLVRSWVNSVLPALVLLSYAVPTFGLS